jgi:hypothetical protein
MIKHLIYIELSVCGRLKIWNSNKSLKHLNLNKLDFHIYPKRKKIILQCNIGSQRKVILMEWNLLNREYRHTYDNNYILLVCQYDAF